MARKGMNGQLNMFELLGLGASSSQPGEVEMVPFVPEREENNSLEKENAGNVSKVLEDKKEEQIIINPKKLEKAKSSDVVMHKEVLDSKGNIIFSISYLNYNKILIKRKNQEEEIISFDNSKEAVDFYIEEILKMEEVR